MSIFDQVRQKIPQQGMQAPVGAPMGGGAFPFVPNRPQFQLPPIPPGLSPGMQQQAQFDRRPPMMAPNLGPMIPASGSFSDRVKAAAGIKEQAMFQQQLADFQRGTAQARRETDPRRAMLAQLAQRPVGGFGYGNLEQYVRSMQSPGLRY